MGVELSTKDFFEKYDEKWLVEPIFISHVSQKDEMRKFIKEELRADCCFQATRVVNNFHDRWRGFFSDQKDAMFFKLRFG